MSDGKLTLERFLELCSAYGSKLERWPEAERAAGQALLSESEEARAALSNEEVLDAALSALAPEPLPAALAQRVLRVPSERRAPVRLRLPRRALWAPALGWAAAAAVGIWLGTRSAPEDTASMEAAESQQVEPAGMLGEEEVLATARGAIDFIEELP